MRKTKESQDVPNARISFLITGLPGSRFVGNLTSLPVGMTYSALSVLRTGISSHGGTACGHEFLKLFISDMLRQR